MPGIPVTCRWKVWMIPLYINYLVIVEDSLSIICSWESRSHHYHAYFLQQFQHSPFFYTWLLSDCFQLMKHTLWAFSCFQRLHRWRILRFYGGTTHSACQSHSITCTMAMGWGTAHPDLLAPVGFGMCLKADSTDTLTLEIIQPACNTLGKHSYQLIHEINWSRKKKVGWVTLKRN